MNTAIEDVKKLLNELPQDATYEDIQYHIYVLEKAKRGLQDALEGKTLDQDEVEKRMSQWITE